MYAVEVRLMKGHDAGFTTDKAFFFFCFLRLNPQILPPVYSLYSSVLLLFSVHFYPRLFGSRSFGLGGVTLSRQCGKMKFLKAKLVRFFRNSEASTVLLIYAGLLIFIPHIVYVPVYSNVLNF